MLNGQIKDAYLNILEEELVSAMGCTEPIAIAYAAAKAREVLGALPERMSVKASANIIKNVKSVVVPNTGHLRGIAAAACAGALVGDASAELEVLSRVGEQDTARIAEYLARNVCAVEVSRAPCVFHIVVSARAGESTSSVEIMGSHTNIVRIEKDGKTLFSKRADGEAHQDCRTDRELLTVEDIVAFADEIDIDLVKSVLDRQIEYNTAIAKEGLKGEWGANIGRILLKAYGDGVHNRAKAYAAAGSDARMNGCELPVVINSGSGNQGLTASLPVIVYAQEWGVSQEQLYRALIVSNLITIHLKTGIGPLSAYCGATSAGAGAGAGVCYLAGGKFREVAHTIVNALAINSGMICDGAKASCAAKIASAVDAGLLGMQMQENGSQFYGGDGIVVKGVENTIRNVGTLARDGMRQTDQTIIELMTE